MTREEHSPMQEAIDAALACVRACETCATECLEEQGIGALRDCIRLDRDCADVCALSASYMARESRFHPQLCQLCAEICDACAAECERFPHLIHCRECAEACRRCADCCRSMALVMA